MRDLLTAGPRAHSKTPLRYWPQRGRFLSARFAAERGVRELPPAGPRDAAFVTCRPQGRRAAGPD